MEKKTLNAEELNRVSGGTARETAAGSKRLRGKTDPAGGNAGPALSSERKETDGNIGRIDDNALLP